jgi:hypothetical protein
MRQLIWIPFLIALLAGGLLWLLPAANDVPTWVKLAVGGAAVLSGLGAVVLTLTAPPAPRPERKRGGSAHVTGAHSSAKGGNAGSGEHGGHGGDATVIGDHSHAQGGQGGD